MKTKTITVMASTSNGERTLQDTFLNALDHVLSVGGRIVSITSDTSRHKKAYVLVPANLPDGKIVSG